MASTEIQSIREALETINEAPKNAGSIRSFGKHTTDDTGSLYPDVQKAVDSADSAMKRTNTKVFSVEKHIGSIIVSYELDRFSRLTKENMKALTKISNFEQVFVSKSGKYEYINLVFKSNA